MTDKPALIAIAAAMLAITSAAFAQASDPVRAKRPAGSLEGLYARSAVPPGRIGVNRNDPALTGGGSFGYNERVEQGF